MDSRKKRIEYLAALCAELGPEDGIDPRRLRDTSRSRHAGNRKDRQLCKQIERALGLVLPDLDSVLAELQILRVEPAPDSTHILVIVAPCPGGPRPAEVEVAEALGQCATRLRYEASCAINRRRAPEITYHYVPADEEAPS